MSRSKPIHERDLALLHESGALHGVTVRGVPGGWTVHARVGLDDRPLALDRKNDLRVFANLERLAAYLRRIGVRSFAVDQATWAEEAVS